MNSQRTIEKALNEIQQAESLMSQAAKTYYSARKRLESIYSPTAPKRVKKGLSVDQVATVLYKRNKNVYRQKPAL